MTIFPARGSLATLSSRARSAKQCCLLTIFIIVEFELRLNIMPRENSNSLKILLAYFAAFFG